MRPSGPKLTPPPRTCSDTRKQMWSTPWTYSPGGVPSAVQPETTSAQRTNMATSDPQTRTHRYSGTRLSAGKGARLSARGSSRRRGKAPALPTPCPAPSSLPGHALYSALGGESCCNCGGVQPLAPPNAPLHLCGVPTPRVPQTRPTAFQTPHPLWPRPHPLSFPAAGPAPAPPRFPCAPGYGALAPSTGRFCPNPPIPRNRGQVKQHPPPKNRTVGKTSLPSSGFLVPSGAFLK